mmetsp:Transcript_10896/g.19752  ORF Transcript_10896/g.19752 Transcript_10896/m.19752 type:complete len:487 (-) Transcript_10896:110-1570(-)
MRLYEGALIEHDNERKRSRPVSSLHVQPIGDKQQTVPNLTGGKRKPSKYQIQQQLYRQQQSQQEQQNMRPVYHHKPTRARGGGGPPRKSYSPYDYIPGMEEEYGYGGDPSRKRSPYYRDKNGKVNRDEPEHLRAMMEEGIPVKQWIVLLVLLVVGLFQLRKTVLGPTANDKTSKKPPSARKTPIKCPKKAGKQKGKKNASAKSPAPRSVSKAQEKQQKRVNDESSPVKSEASRYAPTPTTTNVESGTALPEKESIAPKKDAAPPVEAKKAKTSKKKKNTPSQPVQSSKDENVAAEEEKQSQSPLIASANGAGITAVSCDGEVDGWQTVGQDTRSEPNTVKDVHEGPGAQNVVDEVIQQSAEENFAKSASGASNELAAPALVAGSAAKSMGNNEKKNGKAQKKKKNGTVNENGSVGTEPAMVEASSSPIPPPVASTDDDAALALKLQEEEERLAKALSLPTGEDSWAEVTPKKSRRRSNDPMVSAAH